MSASPKFAHVVFQTGQPNQMRDWYCAVLDGHVVYQDEALCFITYDDEHHRVALLSPPVRVATQTSHHRVCPSHRLHLREHRRPARPLCVVAGAGNNPRRLHRPRGDDVDVLPGSRRHLRRDADRQLRQSRRRHQLHARSGIRGRLGWPGVRPRSDARGPPSRCQRRGTHRSRLVAAGRAAQSDVHSRRRVKPAAAMTTLAETASLAEPSRFAETHWPTRRSGGTTPAGADILERIRAIQRLLEKNSDDSEAARRVVDESITALTEAGAFKIAQPRRYGGYETSVRTMLDVSAAVAEADGGTAWVVTLVQRLRLADKPFPGTGPRRRVGNRPGCEGLRRARADRRVGTDSRGRPGDRTLVSQLRVLARRLGGAGYPPHRSSTARSSTTALRSSPAKIWNSKKPGSRPG